MRPQRHLPDLPLDAPIDMSAYRREQWIESKQAEILADLKNGSWHSYNRDMTFYPRDAMQEVGELDPEEVFRLNTATAAFWLAAHCSADVDRGQMKLNAADVLEKVFGKAVEVMAKNLAEREYEKEVMNEH